jgi:hypothetical protein
MTKTFKQQVEDALVEYDQCPDFQEKGYVCASCSKKALARILAAHNAELDRIAEWLPKELFRASPPIIGAKDGGTQYAEDIGFNKGVIKSTAYIQAQKGS